jgi:hypothetical protein
MRILGVALLLGLTAVPAYSQGVAPSSSPNFTPGFRLGEGKEYTDEEKARMQENEDAAKAARAKLPDAKVSSDPWAGARAADTTSVKTPKKPKAATQ